MTTSRQSTPNPDDKPLAGLAAPPHGVIPTRSSEWIKINSAMHGYLCCPAKHRETDRFNALLFLGGSEGGTWPGMIEYLADRGYLALGVVYHHGARERPELEGVPKDLVGIEVAGFKDALDILQQHPASSGRVGMIGGSRGGELVLILGALYGSDATPQRCTGIRAIVSMVPSAAVFSAYSHNVETNTRFDEILEPAWLVEGIPYYGKTDDPQINQMNKLGRIPTEDISVPLFVVSGGKDKVWYQDPAVSISSMPSAFNARHIIRHGGRDNPDDVAKHFPDAGHYFPPPYLLDSTEDEVLLKYGGVSALAIRDATRDVNSSLDKFLDTHLPRGVVAE